MEEEKMDKLDQIARQYPDNIMFTGYELHTRGDVQKAFTGSGMILDPSCRVQYIDDGLLATFRAGIEDGEMEPWFAIAWGTLREDERETWLHYWRLLENQA